MKMTKKEKRAKMQRVRFGTEKLPYECCNWTPAAEYKLEQLFLRGYDYSDIALALGRTESAIHLKLNQMGLLIYGEHNQRKKSPRMPKELGCLCINCSVRGQACCGCIQNTEEG